MNRDYFLEKIKERFPSNFENYSYEALPETFLAHDYIPIVCLKHGQWNPKANNHLNGQGCPICGRLKSDKNRVKSTENFIQRSKKCYGDYLDYTKTVYKGLDEKLIITCPKHGDMEVVARDHFFSRKSNKYGCRECTVEDYKETRVSKALERFRLTHGDTYDYSKLVYVNMNVEGEIVCRKHGSFWQRLFKHAEGSRCPKCVREEEKLSLEDFTSKARSLFGDKYDYSRVTLSLGVNVKMQIGCPVHGFFVQRLNSHLQGNGCKKCYQEEQRKSTDEFIRDARSIHGDKYDYSRVVYVGNKHKVEIVCPKHGSFFQQPNSHLSYKSGCLLCSDSKGERAVEAFLKKCNIKHVREYSIPNYRYRYDFYLPDTNTFIEFHGVQHYRPVEYFGGKEAFIKIKKRDLRKKMLVEEIGGKLITIPFTHLDKGTLEKTLAVKLKVVFSRK